MNKSQVTTALHAIAPTGEVASLLNHGVDRQVATTEPSGEA